MKMQDLIIGLAEKQNERLMVLKGHRGYRMDADPTHKKEDWEDVWTNNVTRAHVFNDASIRKFMKGFAYNDQRREVRSIPIQFIDGVPQLIPTKKKGIVF